MEVSQYAVAVNILLMITLLSDHTNVKMVSILNMEGGLVSFCFFVRSPTKGLRETYCFVVLSVHLFRGVRREGSLSEHHWTITRSMVNVMCHFI